MILLTSAHYGPICIGFVGLIYNNEKFVANLLESSYINDKELIDDNCTIGEENTTN